MGATMGATHLSRVQPSSVGYSVSQRVHISSVVLLTSYTVKKVNEFPVPQAGCHLPNSSWTGIIKLFPSRDSLVSDIPPGDGKMPNLFLQCICNSFFIGAGGLCRDTMGVHCTKYSVQPLCHTSLSFPTPPPPLPISVSCYLQFTSLFWQFW